MSGADGEYSITGATGDWHIVVGLEVHAQVTSRSKLFSGAATDFGAEPNTQVSFIDAAFPGMLPTINEECVRQAVRTGLALEAKINKVSRFDRKNYFYADLPAGYQISQYQMPIVGEGVVHVELPDGREKAIGIERLHLEQDAGKSIHDQSPRYSYVDLNRAGVALMEIVSKPDMRSPAEAGAYLRKLRTLLRYIGACDGNMEQGSMRADVNVSVRRPGEPFGTRCEIKNVNSVRFVMQAIEYEARRQIDILEDGGTIDQETRLFDPDKGETRAMRSKEEAHDYRYFPDPDLLPLVFDDAFIEAARLSLPELPDAKRRRYIESYGIAPQNAVMIAEDFEAAQWFEALVGRLATATGKAEAEIASRASNFLLSDLYGHLNRLGLDLSASPVDPSRAAELLALVIAGTISGSAAKEVLEEMIASGRAPAVIVEEKGLKQVSDSAALEALVDRVIAANPAQVAQYREGKTKLLGFFVGQVMKESRGQANPAIVNEILMKKLG
ncbi:MAG: Asp-tRNA(Asn)/Glu-tRNA(Gln) amidotransferase subunit GatB [Rhodothalassiaceae bacterium]